MLQFAIDMPLATRSVMSPSNLAGRGSTRTHHHGQPLQLHSHATPLLSTLTPIRSVNLEPNRSVSVLPTRGRGGSSYNLHQVGSFASHLPIRKSSTATESSTTGPARFGNQQLPAGVPLNEDEAQPMKSLIGDHSMYGI